MILLMTGAALGAVIGWGVTRIRLGKLNAVKRLLDKGDHTLLVARFNNPYLTDAVTLLLQGEYERSVEPESKKSNLVAIKGGKDDE